LSHLRVLLLEGNPRLRVQEVVRSLCGQPALFGVPVLTPSEPTPAVTSLRALSLGLHALRSSVSVMVGGGWCVR
jgi:hypothetical protein